METTCPILPTRGKTAQMSRVVFKLRIKLCWGRWEKATVCNKLSVFVNPATALSLSEMGLGEANSA